MSQSVAQLPSFSIDGLQTVVKVFLVNGESRSLRLDERTDVNVSPSPPPPPPPPPPSPREKWEEQIRDIHMYTYMALLDNVYTRSSLRKNLTEEERSSSLC